MSDNDKQYRDEWLPVNPKGDADLMGNQPLHDCSEGNVLTHDDFIQMAFDLEDTARHYEKKMSGGAVPNTLRRMRDDAILLAEVSDGAWRFEAGAAAGLWSKHELGVVFHSSGGEPNE